MNQGELKRRPRARHVDPAALAFDPDHAPQDLVRCERRIVGPRRVAARKKDGAIATPALPLRHQPMGEQPASDAKQQNVAAPQPLWINRLHGDSFAAADRGNHAGAARAKAYRVAGGQQIPAQDRQQASRVDRRGTLGLRHRRSARRGRLAPRDPDYSAALSAPLIRGQFTYPGFWGHLPPPARRLKTDRRAGFSRPSSGALERTQSRRDRERIGARRPARCSPLDPETRA